MYFRQFDIFHSTEYIVLQGGLRVLHINQEEYDLTEVGYFDIYPEADEPRFSGTWSNYPYFPSGKSG